METEIPKTRKIDYRWVTEKFGLLLAPAIAYFLVFTYESAYCRAFAIPPSFIHPDLTTILIYTSIVVWVGFVLVGLIDMWIGFSKAPPPQPYVHALRLYLPFIFVLVLIMLLYGAAHWGHWLVFGLLLVAATLLDFLQALTRNQEKPYLARLQGPAAILSGPGTVWDVAKRRLDVEVVVFLVVLYLAYLASSTLGQTEAFNERLFLVPSTQPDSVVVRVYGDKILCAAIDLHTKKPLKQFYILTAGADKSLHFDTKELGPLSF
jgi:hypothetical protein